MPTILGIESSCDETAASICTDAHIVSNVVSSQLNHAEYGGVIPEIASREHLKRISGVTEKALQDAGITWQDLDGVAVTSSPGLLGSLVVGVSYAKGLSASLNIPLISIHHMQAHVMAIYIEHEPQHPYICLTVSGGHTQLIKVDAPDQMTILGQTRDDAAGEAFDKIGKMLGLAYPAGPIIDTLSQSGQASFALPISDVSDWDFSFSGLKTAMLYHLRDAVKKDPDYITKNLHDLAASTQETIINSLMQKLEMAVSHFDIPRVGIAGGVSANSGLRKALSDRPSWNVYIPSLQYTTDNAAMIAMAGYFKYVQDEFAGLDLLPSPRSGF